VEWKQLSKFGKEGLLNPDNSEYTPGVIFYRSCRAYQNPPTQFAREPIKKAPREVRGAFHFSDRRFHRWRCWF